MAVDDDAAAFGDGDDSAICVGGRDDAFCDNLHHYE
jgi:hypothetical protein